MKKTSLLFLLLISNLSSFAQNKIEAEKLVAEGVPYHDKGDYSGAINKYNKALELDKDNLLALSEKAFSLISLEKYDDAIEICKLAIKAHPGEDVKNVYVSYGNALDHLKKTDESLEVYSEGIKLFPNYYQLHFNKGITYSSIKKYDDAINCFKNSISINPKHAGSLNAIGILEMEQNRIPSILAFSRFFIIEPQTARSKKNFQYMRKLLMQGVTETTKQSVSINIDSNMLNDSTDTGKKKENNFSMTDLILSMDASQDFDKKNNNKTDVEKFIRKFETICSSLEESKKDNFGFYWEFLAPYFIEMKNKKLIEPFAYIVFVDSSSEDVSKWYKKNQDELDRFYDWSKNYNWKKQ
ncbi:tetratricopeptide repeat protein [Flavobacterium succinicans]|uniref:Photosystem I assembly protein Ycf3 n=1 Tax=Flavobacterium succinicans TaxID=29536 RepID=A0A199XQ90_9FLAO|nr:tetratricopeptide repeat protein [Flavobacterium succinicans]OAZ03913.1 photosystem I assembly protein Ycf3 [Flavobacterium succinicans]